MMEALIVSLRELAAVLRQRIYALSVVIEQAKSCVAVVAEKATALARHMVMVDGHASYPTLRASVIRKPTTYRASAALVSQQLVVLRGGHPAPSLPRELDRAIAAVVDMSGTNPAPRANTITPVWSTDARAFRHDVIVTKGNSRWKL